MVVDEKTAEIKRPDSEPFLEDVYCEHGQFCGNLESISWISERVSYYFHDGIYGLELKSRKKTSNSSI
jgi:hypothetical protein